MGLGSCSPKGEKPMLIANSTNKPPPTCLVLCNLYREMHLLSPVVI